MRQQAGHWFAQVREMGDLTEQETAVAEQFKALLREVGSPPIEPCAPNLNRSASSVAAMRLMSANRTIRLK